MAVKKVAKNARCVIIAGSPDADIGFIKTAVSGGDYVICADKGYKYAHAAGITPDLIVGDFDSYIGELPPDVDTVRLNVRKDYSDTYVCARYAVEQGFIEVLRIVGLEIGHLIGDQRIGNRVGLVEAVAAEFINEPKEFFRLFLCIAVFD